MWRCVRGRLVEFTILGFGKQNTWGIHYTKHFSFYTKVLLQISYIQKTYIWYKIIVSFVALSKIFKTSDMYECYYRSVLYVADEKVSKCEIFIDNIYFVYLKETLDVSVIGF